MYGFGMIKGLGVTIKNFLVPSRMFTIHQYPNRKIGVFGLAKLANTPVINYCINNPGKSMKAMVGLVSVEDRMPQHPRFRGQEFTWYEERCTGCASCAKYCPLGIIRIVTAPGDIALQDGGKYDIEVFDIETGRCMYCGLCVEACPYDALHMGSGFEESTYTRSELVVDVDRLKSSPKRPSTWFRPQLEAKSYDPRGADELQWDQVGRHEKPKLEHQEEKWAKR